MESYKLSYIFIKLDCLHPLFSRLWQVNYYVNCLGILDYLIKLFKDISNNN